MTPLPKLPAGDLRAIYLHWTGADYETCFPAYHFCIARSGAHVRVVATHDLRANMRPLRAGDAAAYAAHTAGRNSYAIGIAICGMHAARPDDFGAFALRDDAVDAACALAAHLATFYDIPLAAIRTHAEAALEDGYFGCGYEQRWDIARLRASDAPLMPVEGSATGETLRARVRRHLRGKGVRADA